MRARLALAVSGVDFEHREILLRDKPDAMLAASPKGTVPVLVIGDQVIDESYDIMLWALSQNDPEGWLNAPNFDLVAAADGDFKTSLDRYKYASRYDSGTGEQARDQASVFLRRLDGMLDGQSYLYGDHPTLPDMAIATFVRQFAHVDLDWFNGQDWTDVSRWLADFKASDRFLDVMGKYPPWQPQ